MGDVVGMKQKHKYPIAYCITTFACDEGCCSEKVWVNGDIKVPQVIVNRRSKHLMKIKLPPGIYTREYKPRPGERVFVQATSELIRMTAERFVKEKWEDIKSTFLKQGDAIRHYLKEWTEPGMPWLVTIEPERKMLQLKTGEVVPYVCPVCRQHFPYDAELETLSCGCGFSGTAKEFSEIEFEIQTWIN